MKQTPKENTLPDENRWNGWVSFVWFIAMITMMASVLLIATMGFIEVPRTYYGTEKVINWTVLSWAIGQSIAALMLAALFSIANATYRNSCKTMRMLTAVAKLTMADRAKAKREQPVKTAATEQSPQN